MKIVIISGNNETLVVDHHMGNLDQTRFFFSKVG